VDLILQSAEGLLRRGARLVFLGEEDKDDCAARVKRLHETAPERIGVAIGRDERLARLILAGSDALLMPSMLEPTGQMQLCALRYGAVPIARRTGVLADTVIDVSEAVPEDQTTTGFLFNEFRFKDFAACADRALTLFFEQPESWRKLRAAGMAQDWSWTRSAMEYEKLYLRARAKAAARRKRG
jgi:starch synthase